jgi:hypothetical protein
VSKKKEEHAVAPILRVAPLGELRVYTVTEYELDALGNGSPGSLYLNFGLALVPVAVAFLITLLSTDIPTIGGKIFFISACIIFFLVGTLSFILAAKHHVSTKTLVDQIENRMPPDPIGRDSVPESDKTAIRKEDGGSSPPSSTT